MSDPQLSPTLERAMRLDLASEPRLDRIARLAGFVFGCPHAGVSFIDAELVRWKASVGGDYEPTPRQQTICDYTIRSEEPFAVPDTLRDPRLCQHPATKRGIRFYAGQAIHAPDGRRIGTLCAWDTQPHEVTPAQISLLRDLAAQADAVLERIDLALTLYRLEESEQRFRALIEPNPDAVYTIAPNGHFMSVNDATCRLTGYTRDELLDHSFVPLIAPEDLSHTLACFQRCLAGEVQYLQIQLRRKDGSRVHVAISASPYLVGGKLMGVAGISRDVTEKVLAEQRLNLALESSGQRVWDWDIVSGEIRMCGPLVPSLCLPDTISAAEFVDPALSPIHPDDRVRVVKCLHDVRTEQAGSVETEYRFRLDNGDYNWTLIRGSVIQRDENGLPVRAIGTLKDIHARTLAEQARLREAERMALALQAGGVGIFETNLQSGERYWDKRMWELCGFASENEAPTPGRLLQVVHPDERDQFEARRQALLDGSLTAYDVVHRVIWPDGSIHHLRLVAKVVKVSEVAPRLLLGTCWDVTESRALQQELTYRASHDPLTGLMNRYAFEQRLEDACRSCQSDDQEHTLCFIDLDRFKVINDTAGHAAGDALLRELGQFLARQVRASDVLARLGGDEFGLLLQACGTAQAAEVAQTLVAVLETFSFAWEGRVYKISASIGIALLTKDTRDVGTAMSQADVACYAAKAAGRNRISIYHPKQGEASVRHRQLQVAAGIREALDADRFCLFAQPIVSTTTDAGPPHYELLVRMRDTQGELLAPGAFIPAAERFNLMHRIDRWVLREALEQQGAALAAVPGLIVSLNLSAQSLNDASFLPLVETLLKASPLAPERIQFEITETAAVTNPASAIKIIKELRQRGCAITLDDFGAGLSSFSYLRQFPMDYIKIDGSFVRRLKHSVLDRTIVQSIRQIAYMLGAKTVAEYVEDDELLAIVRELGIDYAQGYGIGRPQPLEAVLTEHRESAGG